MSEDFSATHARGAGTPPPDVAAPGDPRKRMPNRRQQITFPVKRLTGLGHEQFYQCSIGFHADGSAGEVFLSAPGRLGEDIDIAARDIAILISFALQYGAPLEVLQGAVTRGDEGEPQGLAGAALDEISKVLWPGEREA